VVTDVVLSLLYVQGMVEIIVAATTVVVMGLTALNAAHGGLVLGRLARRLALRPRLARPRGGRDPAGRAARGDPLPLRGPDVPDLGDGGVGHRAEPGLIHALSKTSTDEMKSRPGIPRPAFV
jgi:hypothetical protein